MAYTPYSQYNPYNFQPAYQSPYVPPRYDASQMSGQQIPATPTPAQAPVQQPTVSQNGFVCRPVTSKEEAMAVQADYLSPGTIMPDLGHGMMYLKRFDANTGLSNFFEFAIVQGKPEEDNIAVPVKENVDYSEIFKDFGSQLDSLSDRVDTLMDKIESYKPKTTSQRSASKE